MTAKNTSATTPSTAVYHTVRLSRHLSPVRARRAFCCIPGAPVAYPANSFLCRSVNLLYTWRPRGLFCNSFLCRSVNACFYIYIYIYKIYIYIYKSYLHTRAHSPATLCPNATPSVPYFRSFTAPKPTRTNWPLHFYIYRCLKICKQILVEVSNSY
jgi:hypothetical protein